MKGKIIPKGYIDGITIFGVGIAIGSVGLFLFPPISNAFAPIKNFLGIALIILSFFYIYTAVEHMLGVKKGFDKLKKHKE